MIEISICQLHILLSRTAQISLEVHFCVELHTKKPWLHDTVGGLQQVSRLCDVSCWLWRILHPTNVFLIIRWNASQNS